MLILRRLIEGYTPELAVKLLTKLKKTKSYRLVLLEVRSDHFVFEYPGFNERKTAGQCIIVI